MAIHYAGYFVQATLISAFYSCYSFYIVKVGDGAAPKYLDPKYLGIVKTLPNPT